ncbi:MAG: cardiolipin synthase B [Nitrospirae bacterium]|nr:cardiolipin synthase B [Nitrospirota bacterium]MBI3593619.1 cardiolipin synthase B [Nitrospirota bacterium]
MTSQPFINGALDGQIFERASGAPLIQGNRVDILMDAKENYPAWEAAIRSAKSHIFFESYIIFDDEIGNHFTDLLIAQVKNGIRVRLIYDWVGAFGRNSSRFWKRLRSAGVEVRCFNPPQWRSEIGFFTRDHRKMLTVDGRVGFVSGLCLGQKWVGNRERAIEPWRDTGVRIQGPAVSELERAFASVWETTGTPIPKEELEKRAPSGQEGNTALRVIATIPNRAGVYRLDQLIAGIATRTLWLTDAYFVGVSPYLQALKAAVVDGVDVRLLVPGTTDIPVLQAISRMGYKLLLEAGVRIFEWNGSMLHAKTAVVDGKWARIGSTNLNLASWIGNYELDVAIEDPELAKKMEEIYLEDLSHSTEIILSEQYRVNPVRKRRVEADQERTLRGGKASQVGVGAIRLGYVVGSVVKNQKELGPAGIKLMTGIGILLLSMGLLGLLWPLLLTIPLAIIFGWIGTKLLVNAYRTHSNGE